jgi:membrane-associated phospholipid phosphatase
MITQEYGSLDALFLIITNLGSENAYIALLAVYYWLNPVVGRTFGALFGVSVSLNTLLKVAFNLPRPYQLDPTLKISKAAIETGGGGGLPSGHAQNAAFAWGFLALDQRKSWVTALSVALIFAIGFSRVYLGVHFVSDVLVGFAVGAVIAFAAARIRIPVFDLTGRIVLFAAGLISSFLVPELARSFAVMIGFLITGVEFQPPRAWPARIAFVVAGLVLAFVLLTASSLLLPEAIKRSGWGSYLRYAFLTLFATELWPRVARGLPSARA